MSVAVFAFCGGAEAAPDAGPEAEPAGKVTLSNDSLWRVRVVWGTEEVLLKSGEIGHYRLDIGRTWRKAFAKTKQNVLEDEYFEVKKVPLLRLPRQTVPDWTQPAFDDSTWVRVRGPVLHTHGYIDNPTHWKLLLPRNRFKVSDPAKTGVCDQEGYALHFAPVPAITTRTTTQEESAETPRTPNGRKCTADTQRTDEGLRGLGVSVTWTLNVQC